MKKTTIILLIQLITMSLFASFDFFPENPAELADRDFSHVMIPALTYNLNINNSLLNLDNFNLFQEGRRLSESDKDLLTKEDIELFGNLSATWIDIGYRNWNFSLKTLASFEAELLETTYTDLVFNGNQANVIYTSTNGEGSEAFGFWKASFEYAYPQAVNLGMIPGIFPAETTSNIISTLRDQPIFVGGNINFNYSMEYAGLVESKQNFGAMSDSIFYDIYARIYTTDEKSSGRLHPSLGFGIKVPIKDGNFHFSMDDIFLQLRYKNLAGLEFSKVVTDSLLYLQDDHEAYEYENIENDSIRAGSKTLKINPSFRLGAEYTFFNRLNVMMSFANDRFAYLDGFYTAAGTEFGMIPAQIGFGFDENVYYQFKTGLKLNRFEWMVGTTFYHGFFRYARGIGLQSAINIKF